MDEGSFVVVKLNGFTTADAGAEQSSLAALREADEMAYYKDGDTLWVKLFNDDSAPPPGAPPFGLPPSVTVSKDTSVSTAMLD